jgi:hypothetical protein
MPRLTSPTVAVVSGDLVTDVRLEDVVGRGSHSFPFPLNLSLLYLFPLNLS